MKGFYFSFDALLAMTVMAASLFVVAQSSDIATDSFQADTVAYRSADTSGRDAMKLASVQESGEFLNESRQEDILQEPGITIEEEDFDRSVLDTIALLWAQNTSASRNYARELTRTYFDSKVPGEYGYRVQIGESGPWNILYSNSNISQSKVVSSTARPVSGYRIGSPAEGYRSRARLTAISGRKVETLFFGGYVGDGDITYRLELPELDTALNATLEGDFSGPFELRFNGVYAGSYTPSTGNLSADRFHVCSRDRNQSVCEALSPGVNTVEIDFTGENQSIGGGFLKVTYNRTTGLDPSRNFIQRKKRIPGIDGVINYYGSFSVPGSIQGMEARFHYETSNQTLFVRAGNSTIYEKRTVGERTVNLENETIFGNITESGMSYESMSNGTVPLRIGLKNIDQARRQAIADSVSVVDISGSMGCSWFEDPPCKIDEAKNASKTFGDIILNASGNRAGFVSYSSSVQDVHNLTGNNQSLENMIEAQSAGGSTCIGCGILEAVDVLKERYVEDFFPRKSEWRYTTEYLDSSPPERNLDEWTEVEYNSSDWENGSAIIGTSTGSETQIGSFEGSVFLRKKFYVGISDYRNATLYIRSEDSAAVYVNGEVVDNDTSVHDGSYWNREVSFNSSILQVGENVVAVRLENADSSTEAEFDASMNATQRRRRSMIVMSDGSPNVETDMTGVPDHNNNSEEDAADHTIEAACRAHENHSVKVYAVGFGSAVNEEVMNLTAKCGGGEYYYSSTDELQDVFRQISNRILEASFVGQTIETGDPDAFGRIYADSYIRFNHSRSTEREYGEFSIQQTSERFGGGIESPKNGSFHVPEEVGVESARLISYSGNRWTDRVLVDESGSFQHAFQLWRYGDEYQRLGDPFVVRLPVSMVENGRNNVSVDTALNYSTPKGGSPDNRVFYTVTVDGFTGYGEVFPTQSQASQDAKQRLKEQLDVNGDGEPDVSLDENLEIDSSFADEQPFIWGPAMVKLVVWK